MDFNEFYGLSSAKKEHLQNQDSSAVAPQQQ